MFLLIPNTIWTERNYKYNVEIYQPIVMNRLTEMAEENHRFPWCFFFHPYKKSGVGRAPIGDFEHLL